MPLEAVLQGVVVRQRDTLEGVAIFVAAAEAGSFSGAGRRLGVSPSAISQAIRGLEARLGAPLFRRSTRSLSLTDVGREYLLAAAPALAQLQQAAEAAAGRGGRPAGPLRLTMPRAPFDLVVAPALAGFKDAYLEVDLEIAVEARLVDIVKEGYDAGLRYGRHLDKDMVAVQVAPQSTAVLVASPTYLSASDLPRAPMDLLSLRSVGCRSQATGQIIPWTLQSAGEVVQIVPPSPTIVHDLTSQIDLATRGLGILSVPAAMVAERLATGELVRVLPSWSSTLEALYIYFPNRHHQSVALRTFITFLQRRGGGLTSRTAEP